MRVYRFQLEPTATYRQRSCLWFEGVASGDGILTITVIYTKAFRMEQDTYGVEEVPGAQFGERRFQFIRVTEQRGESPQEQPYVVAIGGRFNACSCDAGAKGFRRSNCKHLDSVLALLAAGKLPARPLQGAF